jgi:hypothetical protein
MDTHNTKYSTTLDAIFQIVTKDLGMEWILLPQQQRSTILLLYLRHQHVVGVVTVEAIRRAYRMPNLYTTTQDSQPMTTTTE